MSIARLCLLLLFFFASREQKQKQVKVQEKYERLRSEPVVTNRERWGLAGPRDA